MENYALFNFFDYVGGHCSHLIVFERFELFFVLGFFLFDLSQLLIHFRLKFIFWIGCMCWEIWKLVEFDHSFVNNWNIKRLLFILNASYAHRRVKIIDQWISGAAIRQFSCLKFLFLFWCWTPWMFHWIQWCPKLQVAASYLTWKRMTVDNFGQAWSFLNKWKLLVWILYPWWCRVNSSCRFFVVSESFKLQLKWSDCISELRLSININLLNSQFLSHVVKFFFEHIVFHV